MTFAELKKFLQSEGYQLLTNHMADRDSDERWMAVKSLSDGVRYGVSPCETNGDNVRIVIAPHDLVGENQVTISVTGKAEGTWFEIKAFSLSLQQATDSLPKIERSLVSAWSALAL